MYNEEKYLTKKLLEAPRSCPSPDCTSSNAFNIWQKTYAERGEVIDAHCFKCGYNTKDPYGDLLKVDSSTTPTVQESRVRPQESIPTNTSTYDLSVEDGLQHPIRGIPSRGISYATAEYFGVRIGVSATDGETPIYTLFPRHRNGDQVGWKTRTDDKRFYSSGGNDVELFGANLCKSTGKKIYITEGEYDALSLFQALKEGSSFEGYNPSVVSLPTGAAAAVKSLILSSTLLDGYEEIVLCFDNDEAGKKAREDVCRAYAGRISYMSIPYPFKDANDMLMGGKSTDLKWLGLTGTTKYHPDGIVKAKDLKAKLREAQKTTIYPYPDSMPELNTMTYGARPGTIVTISSGSGCGKTQFLRELMYHYLVNTEEKIAGVYLEEDKMETIRGLMALHMGKRIHLPDVHVTEKEEDDAFDELYGSDRVSLYDFFGGMDDSSLLSKLRYFAITGHKFIFLDHLSIIVAEGALEQDERKRIDVLMKDLAKFVKEFGVVLFLVVHLRKAESSGVPFELGAVPTVDDLRGSGAIKQYSWDVIGLSRNQQHKNDYCANTTETTVLKCRFSGKTGTAGYLYFNEETGRMMHVDKPQNYREPKRLRGV